MADYNVKHTDRYQGSITVPETETNTTDLDVTLFGRINPEYGEALNQDLLNILENFACPEAEGAADYTVAVPDTTQTESGRLSNPTIGQLWYNSTRDMVYHWTGSLWVVIPLREDYAANWGSILDGQQLPKPVSPVTGRVFDYDECIFSVAPGAFTGKPGYISCSVDSNAIVTMEYRLSGTSSMLIGLANYLIIGIRGNYNIGSSISPFPVTPTITPSLSLTAGASQTPIPTPTKTPTPSATQNLASPTPTPTSAPSSTPGASATPTPTSAPSPTPTPTTSPPVTKLGFDGYQYQAFRYSTNGEHLVQRLNITFTNTGTWTISAVYGGSVNLSTGGGPTTGTWLPSGGSASDYSIQIINTSFYNNSVGQPSASEQPTATKDANINWTALSANVSWNAQATSGYQDGVNNSGEGRGDGTTVIYIRHTASNTIVSTTTLIFSVMCSN